MNESQSDHNNSAPKPWVERFPHLLTMGSFLFLGLTVTYEWGYFSVIGSHFQTFETATDYLTNAILWFPLIVLSLGLSILTIVPIFKLRKSWRRQSSGEGDHSNPSQYDLLPGVPLLLAGAIILGFAVGLGAAIAIILYVGWSLVLILLVVPWFELRSRFLILVLLSVPASMTTFYTMGYIDASEQLGEFGSVYRPHYKSSEQPDRNIILLRNFDRGVVIFDPVQTRVEYVQ
jgi:hypothetical protein